MQKFIHVVSVVYSNRSNRYSNQHQTPGYIYSPPKQVYISLPISQNRVSA